MSIDRRTTLKWTAAVAAITGSGWFATQHGITRAPVRTLPARRAAAGYGKDPNLLAPRHDHWPLILGETRKAAAAALATLYLPGDPRAELPTPSAASLGLGDFFDEWLSAPYPDQLADRALLLPLLDRIAAAPDRLEPLRRAPEAALATRRFRDLAVAAYCTTKEGMTAIGFTGDEPRETFEGVPDAVVERLEAAFARLG